MDGDGTHMNAGGSPFGEIVDEIRRDMEPLPTALLDEEMSGFGVPNPRILICGCGGSGNNTMNRITHLGVEGAVTVAINTDKQHLDHTRAMQKLLVGRHITRGLGAGGDPVRYLFLLLTPEENYRSYIPILAQIATLMHSDEIRASFLRCETPSELVAAIKTHTAR